MISKVLGALRSFITIAILLALTSVQADTLVLVGSQNSKLTTLSSADIRKLYLGMPVTMGDHSIVPIVNRSAESLKHKFHKLIVGMSESVYDRKLLRNRLNYAIEPPLVMDDQDALFDILIYDDYALSYTWLSTVDNSEAPIKVLQVIWQEK